MDTSKTAITFQPEPPLREGQFLRSPVLHRGQAMRAFAVVALVTAGAALLGLRPARAEAIQPTGLNARSAITQITGQATSQWIDLAQLDLTKMRRNATKKKTHQMA